MADEFKSMSDAYFQKAPGWNPKLDFPIQETYTPDDVSDIDYSKDIGKPGEYPFVRGIYPNMYRGRFWTMRELAGYGGPEETLERFRFLSRSGVTGLNVICDLATYYGVDSDHPLAIADAGGQGMPFSSLRDMEELFAEVPIDKVSTSIVISTCPAEVVFAQYIAMAEKRGIPLASLRGTIQNEPIKGRYCGYYAGSKYFDLCLKTAGDILEYCVKHVPSFNPMNVNMGDWGSYRVPIAQEIAFTYAIAIAHIEEALRRGLNIDEVGPRFAFHFSAGMAFLEEIAKLRASRKLWARIIKERFGAKDPQSCRCRFSIAPLGPALNPQQPLNNIARLAWMALVGVLGGCQSMYCAAYDEPVALPTEESHRVSLGIQQMIAYELGVTNVVDPLGGSYYVEYLTNKLAEQANQVLNDIDKMGGIKGAIESGWLDKQLEKYAAEDLRRRQTKETLIVGANAFVVPAEKDIVLEPFRVSPEVPRKRAQALAALKQSRNSDMARAALLKLRKTAAKKSEQNLIPLIVEAVKAYATMGEIYGVLQQAYGHPYDSLGVLEAPE